MVTGLTKRGHVRRPSSSSSLASWRFPLRGDSLKSPKHRDPHIVHSSIQSGLDQLNDYLHKEIRISTGAGLVQSVPVTPERTSSASYTTVACRSQLSIKIDRGIDDSPWNVCGGHARDYLRHTSERLQIKPHDMLHLPETSDPAYASPAYDRHCCVTDAAQEHSLEREEGEGAKREESLPRSIVGGVRERGATTRSISSSNSADAIIALYSGNNNSSSNASKHRGVPKGDASRGVVGTSPSPHRRTSDSVYGSSNTSSGSNTDIDSNSEYPENNKSQLINITELCDTIKSGQQKERSSLTSTLDAELLNAVSELLPETPKTLSAGSSTECSPRCARKSTEILSDSTQLRLESLGSDHDAEHNKQTSRLLLEVEKRFESRLVEVERQFRIELEGERHKHVQDLAQRDKAIADMTQQVSQTLQIQTERDEYRTLLEECMTTAEELARQHEFEKDGLARELGGLTLERQRREEELSALRARLERLQDEHKGAQDQINELRFENTRLDRLNNTLRSDVEIAEQRNARIKEHAQETLDQANAEITSLHDAAGVAKNKLAEMGIRITKSEARAKSLQIQLTSTKQQNTELLALCEGL
ncbi:hypothetical protein H4R24_004081 [Coemansia sp. RSA 988]|nr:hypothetical protein H4R24_004081 [Coemansia sp. RSA 988]